MTGHEQMGFRALADPTRRDILKMLASEEMTIAEVAENFDMTRAAVKKHLKAVNDGCLISVKVFGRSAGSATLMPSGMTALEYLNLKLRKTRNDRHCTH